MPNLYPIQANLAFVGYPGSSFVIKNLSFKFEHGKHTLVFVTLAFATQLATPIPQGTPVIISWGRYPNGLSTFYGYVNHYELLKPTAKARQQVSYVLIGTSMNMNNESTVTWTHTTDSYMVRQIASKHQCRSITSVTPNIWPHVSQNTSDFTFMNSLAVQDGYRLFIHNCTVIYLDPIELLLTTNGATVPQFYSSGFANDTVISFELIQGTTVPQGGVQASRSTYGLSPNGRLVQLTSASTSPSALEKVSSPRPIGSYSDAATANTGVQKLNAGWITARAKFIGDVRLLPNQVVSITGTAIDPSVQGLWLVDSAQHDLAPESPQVSSINQYSCTAQLSRNTLAGQVFGNVQPLTALSTLPDPVLQAGQWQSAVQQQVIYG